MAQVSKTEITQFCMQMMGKKSWHLPWIVIATADKSTQFTTLHNGNLQSTAKKKSVFYSIGMSLCSPFHRRPLDTYRHLF